MKLLVEWMNKGLVEEGAISPPTGLGKFVGALEDKANLYSWCELRDATGVKINPRLQRQRPTDTTGFPMYTWTKIPDDSTISWGVKTFTCDDQAGSDRVELELLTLDYVLLAQLTNDAIANWSEEELLVLVEELEANQLDGPMFKRLEEEISNRIDQSAELGSLILPTIYSDVIQTNEDGLATGEIPLPSFWPRSEYFFNIHYGYSAGAEASESTKFWNFMKDWGITIVEIVIAVAILALLLAASVVTGGAALAAAAGVLGTLATPLFLADLGLLAHDYLATGMGVIDENAEGCLFPTTGFNHTYSFSYEVKEIVEDTANNITSNIPPEVVEQFEEWITQGDFWGKVIAIGAFGGISLAAISSILGGSK